MGIFMPKLVHVFLLLVLLCGLSACGSDQALNNPVLEQQIAQLQTQMREQQALEDIRNLFFAYGRSLDERDYQWFASLYAEDAVYIAGGEFVGPQAIAQQLESVISANATGANLHIFTNEKITVDVEAGTATAISRGAFYGQNTNGGPQPLIFATYRDQLVLTTEGWKFQRREIAGDIPGPPNEAANRTR